ncbi:unnamed protein product, partial [Rotaria magnacalcarata]
KKVWCPHPSHSRCTRSGSKPTHPEARRAINATQAEIVNRQSRCNSNWSSVILKEGDRVCLRCYEALPNLLDDSFDLEAMDVQFEDEMEKIDSPCLEESILAKEAAKEKLNAVFQLFNIEKIRDDRRLKKIREQIDCVYRHLKHLCDILEENDSDEAHDMNPDSIRIDESNELLHGMRELFQQTQWFGASDYQARQSIILRRDRGVLAFPEYTRENKFLDEDTVQSVIQFYLQDGVSRVSSNSKDILKIKNELVPVRFMEMSIREALRKFYADHPTIRVGKSSFYSLKPRHVKISSQETHSETRILSDSDKGQGSDREYTKYPWIPIKPTKSYRIPGS